MKIPRASLIRFGWKQIKSEAHAYQILRRAIKVARNSDQRYRNQKWFSTAWSHLEFIKPGTWYKFVKKASPPHYKVMILAEESVDSVGV